MKVFVRPPLSSVAVLGRSFLKWVGWGGVRACLPRRHLPPPIHFNWISFPFMFSHFPHSPGLARQILHHNARVCVCVYMNKTSSIIDIRKSTANVCNMDSYCQSLFRKHYCIHSCVLTCCKQRAPPFFSPTLSAATVQTVFQARVDCQTVVIQIEKRVRVSHARKSPNQCKTLVCVVIIRVQE